MPAESANMMVTVTLGLLAALAHSVGAVLSKRLTVTMPARQLVGPLLALNGLLLVPAVPFVTWNLTPQIVALHALEATLLLLGSLALWDLFEHGEASATITAQSLSPLPATLAVALVLPGVFSPWQAVAALVVVAAVLFGLTDAFPGMGSTRTWVTTGIAASAAGLLTVTSRLLADVGVGVVPTYVARTLLASAVALSVFRPRDVPLRQLPRLAVRAAIVTLHFLLVLLAVRTGSPAIVQTLVATSPLLIVAYESLRDRRLPSSKVVLAAFAVMLGVGVVVIR